MMGVLGIDYDHDDHDDYDDDWDAVDGEDSVSAETYARAQLELSQRHRDEYRLLVYANHVRQLEAKISEMQAEIDGLRSLNPDGIAVPPLVETVNLLIAEKAAAERVE